MSSLVHLFSTVLVICGYISACVADFISDDLQLVYVVECGVSSDTANYPDLAKTTGCSIWTSCSSLLSDVL